MEPRVLFVLGAFPNMPCGVGDYTYHLIMSLSKYQLNLGVLTAQDSRVISRHDVPTDVDLYSIVSSWSIRAIPGILEFVRTLSPDLVHVQYPSQFGHANRSLVANSINMIARQATRGRCKIVTTLHEYDERSLRWRLRALFNIMSSDAVITVNRFDLSSVQAHVPNGAKAIHIPLASSIAKVELTNAEIRRIRNRLAVPEGTTLLAYFGFLTPYKEPEELLQALHLLRTKGRDVRLLLLTHLQPESHPYHRQLLDLMDVLGVRSDCLLGDRFFSEVEVSQYLQASDIGVLPFSEGASERRSSLLALLEHGLPVVSTLGPNNPPEFEDRKNMLLVPQGSAESLASAISELIENDSLVARLEAGAERLASRYSWDEIAARHDELYENLLA